MFRNLAHHVRDVLANIDAMQLGIEEAAAPDRPLTLDRVVAVHRVLLERGADKTVAGRIRDDQNWIGGNDYNPCGADFVPPPETQLGPLLADLVAFCRSEAFLALVQAAVAHAQFETIHPFADGNGRTGRALVLLDLLTDLEAGRAPR